MVRLPPKADMCSAIRNVRFIPIADMTEKPKRIPAVHDVGTLPFRVYYLPSSSTLAVMRPCMCDFRPKRERQ